MSVYIYLSWLHFQGTCPHSKICSLSFLGNSLSIFFSGYILTSFDFSGVGDIPSLSSMTSCLEFQILIKYIWILLTLILIFCLRHLWGHCQCILSQILERKKLDFKLVYEYIAQTPFFGIKTISSFSSRLREFLPSFIIC